MVELESPNELDVFNLRQIVNAMENINDEFNIINKISSEKKRINWR